VADVGRYPSGQQARTSAARDFSLFSFPARALPSPFRFKADGGHAGTAQPADAESARLDRFSRSLRIAWTSLLSQKQ